MTILSRAHAGAPLQFSYVESPVMNGYARYPSIDYVSAFDFRGCPSTVEDPTYRLSVNRDRDNLFCWVNGVLPVRPWPCVTTMRSLEFWSMCNFGSFHNR